jgi:hypothetical protein
MYDTVLACCRWLEDTPWGTTIRASSWMFPVVLWVHLVGLCIWFGTTITVDLQLMGISARRQRAVELSSGLFAWNWIGFAVAFLGGFLLLSAEATTYVTNIGFQLKLAILTPFALIWHIAVQKNVAAWVRSGQHSAMGRWAGAVEFLLWISVVGASVVFLLTNAVTHP